MYCNNDMARNHMQARDPKMTEYNHEQLMHKSEQQLLEERRNIDILVRFHSGWNSCKPKSDGLAVSNSHPQIPIEA